MTKKAAYKNSRSCQIDHGALSTQQPLNGIQYSHLAAGSRHVDTLIPTFLFLDQFLQYSALQCSGGLQQLGGSS